ncbi:MAG: hypothetical protein ACI8ZO_000528 [Flavobacteriales bacterium]|jgi:hypothetical protein
MVGVFYCQKSRNYKTTKNPEHLRDQGFESKKNIMGEN